MDFFRASLSDPYVFGRVAAQHALGDCHAMGAAPTSALAIAVVPFAADAQACTQHSGTPCKRGSDPPAPLHTTCHPEEIKTWQQRRRCNIVWF